MPQFARYRLDFHNTSGTKLAEVWNYRTMTYTKVRNKPGELILSLDANDPNATVLDDNYIVRVLRKVPEQSWVVDFVGIYRGTESVLTSTGTFTASCPGILDLLNDRIVAYPPQSVNRSDFTSKPVETILHTLVKYNATSSGTTADGRVRLATIPNIGVAADSARGATVDYWECAEKPLLDTMYELAAQYKVAYQLVNTGGVSFQWQYVVNTDVSDSQTFSIQRGNVERITYKKDRKAEKTVAIVGSTGEGTLKNYDVRTGNGYDVSTNNREMYVNTGTDNLDAIYLEGDRELSEAEAKDEIEFVVRQTDSSRYGVDFDLNYLVTGGFNKVDYTLVVSEITISSSADEPENISAVLESV